VRPVGGVEKLSYHPVRPVVGQRAPRPGQAPALARLPNVFCHHCQSSACQGHRLSRRLAATGTCHSTSPSRNLAYRRFPPTLLRLTK
jgi:hypothetical protein